MIGDIMYFNLLPPSNTNAAIDTFVTRMKLESKCIYQYIISFNKGFGFSGFEYLTQKVYIPPHIELDKDLDLKIRSELQRKYPLCVSIFSPISFKINSIEV